MIALDFSTLRNSLKVYLQGQDRFRDYDFDGSSMSVLIDLLAYNTFHNAFYLNMLASEMFLDSSQLRDSIISHAKELNYVARSNLSSAANVNITIVTNDGSKGIVIPQFTTFTGRIGSNTYTFSTNTAITAVSNTTTIVAENVSLYEGLINSDQFVIDYSNTIQRYILSSPSVDTSSIFLVSVEDGGSNTLTYAQASSLFDLNANSQVYFIQACESGKYEIVFGDNISGRKPKDASIISVTYRISSGDIPNAISSFSIDGTLSGQANIAVSVNEASSGGAYAESSESIRFNAPRHFTTQERCVTASDYEVLLMENFPEILDVSAVGGEDLDPPQYGKVAITVALDGIDGLPDSKVQEYKDFLSPRSPLSVTPIFLESDYLYVAVDSVVSYNLNSTELDASYIETVIRNMLIAYNSAAINGFKKTLRYSQLVRVIDRADASVVSNSTDLRVIKRLTPTTLGVAQNYSFSFNQELAAQIQGSQRAIIESDAFIYNNQTVTLKDDGDGVINICSDDNPLFSVGTVNYDTGGVSLSNLTVDLLPSDFDYLQVFATTASKDISSQKNVILAIDQLNINITVEGIRV